IEAERVREPDLERVWEEDERVRVVESAICVRDLAFATPEVGGDLRDGGCATSCDDTRVDDTPNGKVGLVHQCRKWRRPAKTMAAPASRTAATTSSSRLEPPRWITAATPASSASS